MLHKWQSKLIKSMRAELKIFDACYLLLKKC